MTNLQKAHEVEDIGLSSSQYGVEVKPEPRPEGFNKPFSKFRQICEFFKAIGYVKGDAIRLKIDNNSKWFQMLTMPSATSIEKDRFGKAFRCTLERCYELSKAGHDILIQHNKPFHFISKDSGKFGNNPDSDHKERIEWINHVVLESDTATLDEQKEWLPILKPLLSVAVFTGNKSIHYWVKVEQSSRYAWENGGREGVKAHLFDYLASAGIDWDKFDKSVLNTYSKFVRLPYMLRKTQKNGSDVYKETELQYINPNPIKLIPRQGNTDKINSKTTIPHTTNIKTSVITNVSTSCLLNSNFVKSMELIEFASANGLKRGERRQLQTTLIACRKIYNASDDQLVDKFTQILKHPASRIGVTFNQAVRDFKTHIAKSSIKGNQSLPDVTSLAIPRDALESLTRQFKARGYTCPVQTAKVILQVILPLLQKLPMQCLKGQVGIKSQEVGRVAGSRYRKAVMQDLNASYIVVERKKAIPKVQTAKYFVNVHKVVYMIFKDYPDLLTWKYTQVTKKVEICAPEGKYLKGNHP